MTREEAIYILKAIQALICPNNESVLENNFSELGGKSLDDITCVFGDDFQITVDNFIEIAKRTDYDDGFGLEEIATDLIVVGKDFWLERHEYDGSEWWEFKTHPTPPTQVEHIDILSRRDCENYYGIATTVKELNFGEEEDGER